MNRDAFFLIALALVFFGISVRLMPHMPNATAITAIAFASSMYLGKRWSVALPIAALFLSDIFIGFYDWKIMASVYGSFALIGILSWLNRKYKGVFPVTLSIVGAALLFFFITNTAVWLFSPWYEKSITGLLYAYELGIPFLRNMLVGDVFYTALLIGVFEFARSLYVALHCRRRAPCRFFSIPSLFLFLTLRLHHGLLYLSFHSRRAR